VLVDIFIPCFIDQVFPETGMNMVKILEKLDVAVHYNGNQTCCGQMAFNSGFWDEAKKMGEKFLLDFPNDRPIVGPSNSCVGFIRNYYGWLFHNTANHLVYKQLTKNIIEFTDFVVNVLNVEDVGATFPHVITYHDSCSSLREYPLTDAPRKLLSKVGKLELREMADRDVCCGFGGTFSAKFEPISVAMTEQKVKNALATGAEYIVSADASCLINQQAYIDKNNLPIRTIHIIDVLASGL
jgi:L-lactate dehydrogenase complex protein LldE